MAKKNKSSSSELEYLRGQNRELKSIVKNLKKQASRATKRQRDITDLEEILAEEQLKDFNKDKEYVGKERCPDCNSLVDIFILGSKRTLVVCTECSYRVTRKS